MLLKCWWILTHHPAECLYQLTLISAMYAMPVQCLNIWVIKMWISLLEHLSVSVCTLKCKLLFFFGNYENTHFPLVFCHFFQVYSAAIKFLHPWMEFCSFFGYNIVSLWVTNSSLSFENFLVYLSVCEQTNYIYVYVYTHTHIKQKASRRQVRKLYMCLEAPGDSRGSPLTPLGMTALLWLQESAPVLCRSSLKYPQKWMESQKSAIYPKTP